MIGDSNGDGGGDDHDAIYMRLLIIQFLHINEINIHEINLYLRLT